MKARIEWRIFKILLIASLLSVIAVFPYIISVQGEILHKTGIPIYAILVAQLLQCAILFSFAIYVGLYLQKIIGFRLPILDAYIRHQSIQHVFKDIAFVSVSLGILVAIFIYATDYLFTIQGAVLSTHQTFAPAWQKLLAALYGGITEEILLRLFLMSVLVWISMKLFTKKTPTDAGIIGSIILSAIIFGLGHLPITASLVQLTPIIVLRAVILNGIGGLVFGWLYWKKGLESAMIAHFTADIFLLTILPLLFG